MGLSIYYRWKAKIGIDEARSLVTRLHEFAKHLPFDNVSPVFEYDPPDGHYEFERGDTDAESRRWKPGDAFLTRKRDDGETESVYVPAIHTIFLTPTSGGRRPRLLGWRRIRRW